MCGNVVLVVVAETSRPSIHSRRVRGGCSYGVAEGGCSSRLVLVLAVVSWAIDRLVTPVVCT